MQEGRIEMLFWQFWCRINLKTNWNCLQHVLDSGNYPLIAKLWDVSDRLAQYLHEECKELAAAAWFWSQQNTVFATHISACSCLGTALWTLEWVKFSGDSSFLHEGWLKQFNVILWFPDHSDTFYIDSWQCL